MKRNRLIDLWVTEFSGAFCVMFLKSVIFGLFFMGNKQNEYNALFILRRRPVNARNMQGEYVARIAESVRRKRLTLNEG